eukprot:scaffold6866_cov118-Isochrysis_galbana.AAC.16
MEDGRAPRLDHQQWLLVYFTYIRLVQHGRMNLVGYYYSPSHIKFVSLPCRGTSNGSVPVPGLGGLRGGQESE